MNTLISIDNTWALWAVLIGVAAIAIYLEQTFHWANKVTGCVLALIITMIMANLRIIPTDAPVYDNVWSYVVPLAVPLLLFNANMKRIWRDSGRVMGIYLLSGFGTIVGGFVAFNLLKGLIPNLKNITPMFVATYTGGSVNFVAMSQSFQVPGETVSAGFVADNLLMAVYFFVLIAIPAIPYFMKKFSHPYIDALESSGKDSNSETISAQFWGRKEISLKDIAFSIAVAFAIVAVSVQLSALFSSMIPTTNFFFTLINGLLGNKYLVITTITMALASIFPSFFNELKGASEIGTFLIHIFFAVIGAPASIYLIITQAPLLLVFAAIIILFNMVFSLLFGKLLKFSIEEIIVASNANVGGPTTAAAMAVSKGWTELIIPAILVGTLGYIIGNYYGIFIGTLLQ